MKIAPCDSHQLFKILLTKSDKLLSIQHGERLQYILAINKIYSLHLLRDVVVIAFPWHTTHKKGQAAFQI